MSDNTQEKLDQCRRHQQIDGGRFLRCARLDEILTIVRGLKAQEEIVRSNGEQDLKHKSGPKIRLIGQRKRLQMGVGQHLTASGSTPGCGHDDKTWDDTHRKSPKGIKARKEWATRYHAWFMECRERGVWSETEDPIL